VGALQSFVLEHAFWTGGMALGVLGLLVLAWLLWYGFSDPPTDAEKNRRHPGDDLLGNEPHRMRGTLAVTVGAPRERVWPFLAQMGQNRAGFYSFDWLERLFGFHIRNTYTVVEAWQAMNPGDYLFYHQCGIGSEVREVRAGAYFTSLSDSRRPSEVPGTVAFVPPLGLDFFAWSRSFILEDAGPGRTRFFTRCDAVFGPFTGTRRALVAVFLGIPSFVMCKSMLRKIKACAERSPG